MINIKTFFISVLMLGLATTSYAQWTPVYPSDSTIQNRAGAISISPFAGSYMLPADQNLNSRPILGLRSGYNFDEHKTVEAVLSYGLGRDRDARESNNFRYGVDLLYHFILPDHISKYVPFVAIGGGGNYVSTPDTPGTPSITSKNFATFNVGGGLKYYLADDIALRGDIRQVTFFGDSTRMNVEYSAGLTFAFGGVKKASTPVKVCAEAEPKTEIVEKIVEKVVEVPKVVEKIVYKPAPVVAEKPAPVPIPVEVKAPQNQNAEVKSKAAMLVESKLKVLSGQNFAINGISLTASGKKALRANVGILKQYPSAKILVIGHASASGPAEYNQKLSEKRANAVRDLLVKAGINKDRISTVGYGNAKPAFVEKNPRNINSREALGNRRVVIEVSGF